MKAAGDGGTVWAAGFDWPALLRLGCGRRGGGLGLLPGEFWALTPAELMLMLEAPGPGPAPLGRARLAELSALYPDEE